MLLSHFSGSLNMQLNQIARPDHTLLNLIETAQYFQQLDKQVKRLFPPNLTAHFRVVCVRDGTLIIHATGSMAASRLKMLLPAHLPHIQALDDHIGDVQIKVLPSQPETKREKTFTISPAAVQTFAQTAERVRHHPELHHALKQLVAHHQKNN